LYRRTKTVKDAGKEIGATDSIRPSSLVFGTKKFCVDESARELPVLVPRRDVFSEEHDDDDPSERRRSLRNPEKRPTTVATRDMTDASRGLLKKKFGRETPKLFSLFLKP